MKKLYLILSFAILPAVTLSAQDIYAPVLQQVEQGSSRLAALRDVMEAERLSYRTGLAPADPVVDGGYLFGSPSTIGVRKDLSIRQELDFPTVYMQRSKLAEVKSAGAGYQYAQERMDLMLEAKRLCIDLIYHNALSRQYEAQKERAERIAESYRRKLESGEANRLEFNKASLTLSQVRQKCTRVIAEREALLTELRRLTGNQTLEFTADTYPAVILPADFETWLGEASSKYPALQYLRNEVEAASREVSLAKASALPKLSVGYMGEFVVGQTFQGVTFGISIPLWENRGRVRYADAVRSASERVADDAAQAYTSRLRMLFSQVGTMQAALAEYEGTLAESRNNDLLYKAFERGEIPLLDYLLEQEYWQEAYGEKLQAERDLHLHLAELEAFKL